MAKPVNLSPDCLNCGSPLGGARWCGNCGQEHVARLHSLRELAGHYAEDFLAIDNKLFRSIVPLFTRPGKLTVEYLHGRRQRYIRPLRFYLIASIAFFAAFSLRYDPNDLTVGDQGVGTRDGEVQADSVIVFAPEDSLAAGKMIDDLERAREYAGDDVVPIATRDSDGTVRVRVNDNASGSVDLDALSRLEFIPILRTRLAAREQELEAMEPEELVRLLLTELMRHAPKAIFLMVPLVALVLKLLYLRRTRFYMEHFIFALHWHTLIFLLLLFILYNPYTPLDLVLVGVVPIYLLFAMRRVYAQGWVRTIFKQQLLLWSYVININIVAAMLALFSAFTI